jgi:hypothetical protein
MYDEKGVIRTVIDDGMVDEIDIVVELDDDEEQIFVFDETLYIIEE